MFPFRLHPFPGTTSAVAVDGTVARRRGRLRLAYRLSGEGRSLVLPRAHGAGTRRDGLWRSTCFEAFVAATGATAYLELNLAPSGDWNAYFFSAYREGMVEAAVVVHGGAVGDGWPAHYAVELALPRPLDEAALELGISVVLADEDGGVRYLALAHAAQRPDFHRRESFLVRLPPGAAA